MVRIRDLAKVGLKVVENDNHTYFKNFANIVDKPFIIENYDLRMRLDQEIKDLHKNDDQSNLNLNKDLDESYSDMCLAMLLNTSNGNSSRCANTADCLKYFTKSPSVRYHLTHQLLYFIFVKKVSFHSHLNMTQS